MLLVLRGSQSEKAKLLAKHIAGCGLSHSHSEIEIVWNSPRLRKVFYHVLRLSVLIPILLEEGIESKALVEAREQIEAKFKSIFEHVIIETLFSEHQNKINGEDFEDLVSSLQWLKFSTMRTIFYQTTTG